MKKTVLFIAVLFFLSVLVTHAQNIIYSEPDRTETTNTSYEIIGKINGNILIYKGYRDLHFIAIYDNEMKLIKKVRQEYISDAIIDADFIQYQDFFYMIYQYHKRGIVYSMGVKIDGNGNKIDNPILLDTTNVSVASNKVYSLSISEDKQKILLFKINTKSDKEHIVTTLLFDKQLNVLHKSKILVDMPEKNDFLAEFVVDNDGDVAFMREAGTKQNDNINKLTLFTKSAFSDNLKLYDIKLSNIYLDDIKLKVDNVNKHYLVTSFYSKQHRGNVDGLFVYLCDKKADKELLTTSVLFTDDLRNQAKSDGGIKTAFNNFFIRNIIMKQDGGFVIITESVYTSSRGNAFNRWDYLYGSPYWNPGSYYYYGSPYSYYNYPWRYNNTFGNGVRYYADNIVILSFDDKSKMEWSNVIPKSQFDDNSDNYIGYGLVNSGSEIHILFNVLEKRNWLLTDQTFSDDGQLNRKPTLKNLDKGYEFMPSQAKQTGSKQLIVPCMYRNYVCFAKIDL
ncbi:MAG: hypothetical protein JSR09_00315 [Bacteroidetes bacterium]|nr:hypothetical protein [Bacteroidota bacterium]MBS1648127.1 hypothetical protein [Bacteroidota bacterium]